MGPPGPQAHPAPPQPPPPSPKAPPNTRARTQGGRRGVRSLPPAVAPLVHAAARPSPSQPPAAIVLEAGISVFKQVPRCVRQEWGRALSRCLEEIAAATHADGDSTPAWERLLIAPTLLLAQTHHTKGAAGQLLLRRRFVAWEENRLADLWGEIQTLRPKLLASTSRPLPRHPPADAPLPPKLERAMSLISCGEYSRASATLAGAPLAPRTMTTLQSLQDRRPAALHKPLPPPPPVPPPVLELDQKVLLSALRSAPRKSAAGPTGLTYDHLRVLLDSPDLLHPLFHVCSLLAAARIPPSITPFLQDGRLIPLAKPGGGVRGIAVGECLRRLVSRAIARQLQAKVTPELTPIQMGVGLPGACEVISHACRVLAEDGATLVKLDCSAAYDSLSRADILNAVRRTIPEAEPFVRLWYSDRPSQHTLRLESGPLAHLTSFEGVEQGDALSPLLFCLGMQQALLGGAAALQQGEVLLVYLDDLILSVPSPSRVPTLVSAFSTALIHVGLTVQPSKTQVWRKSTGSSPPSSLSPLSPEVWRGNDRTEEDGLIVLGAPIGSDAFCRAALDKRRLEEDRVLSSYRDLPSLQARFLLLFWCGTGRSTHLLRQVPPVLTADFAVDRDLSLCCHTAALLHLPTPCWPTTPACLTDPLWTQAMLPLRWGGLGLRSAVALAPAAYFASWADALPTLASLPWFTPYSTQFITPHNPLHLPAISAARSAAAGLARDGCEPPSWADLTDVRARAPPTPPNPLASPDPASRKVGWQREMSQALDSLSFGRLLTQASPLDAVRLRSLSGLGTSQWLHYAPIDPICTVEDSHWLCQARRRMGLPIPGVGGECEKCGTPLDPLGHHVQTCPGLARIHRRHDTMRDVWAEICRQAGADVLIERPLRASPVSLSPDLPGGRRADVVVMGNHLCRGLPVYCDVVITSPITLAGRPTAGWRTDAPPDWAAERAAQGKRNQYSDLSGSGQAVFFPLAADTFGCWGRDAGSLLSALAAQVRDTSSRESNLSTSRHRWWWRVLSFSTQKALARCLLAPPRHEMREVPRGFLPGLIPPDGELLVDRPT